MTLSMKRFVHLCMIFMRKKFRKNGYTVKLRKTKLEYDRLSLKFMGKKVFNDLLLEIRKHYYDKGFRSS